MPRANNMEGKPIKLLLVGSSKSGKSHLAMQAALSGFNLFYLDGDVASGTLAQQPTAIRERVMYLDLKDAYDNGSYVPRFSMLLHKMMHQSPFLWNDTQNRLYKPDAQPTDDVWKIRLTRLGMNDVLVIDSCTSLSYSIMREIADRGGIDLTDVERADRSVYAAARNKMTGILNMLQAAPFHVIVIAHTEEWEQRKRKPGLVKDSGKEDNQIIVGTRQVPMAVSKSFGSTMPKFFTDVGWLSVTPTGTRMIDFGATEDREAGGRFIDKKTVEEYSFAAICKAAGVTLPGASNPLAIAGIEEVKAEELQLAAPAVTLTPGIAPAIAAAKPGLGGLGAILAAKKAAGQ